MKLKQTLCAIAIASLLSSTAYAAGDAAAGTAVAPPVVGGAIVDITATAIMATGYRATELIDADIYNKEGDKIGVIDDFIVSSDNNISLAVISVGGFLGIGDRLVAVPASLFETNARGNIVLPNGNKDDLNALPEFRYTQ